VHPKRTSPRSHDARRLTVIVRNGVPCRDVVVVDNEHFGSPTEHIGEK